MKKISIVVVGLLASSLFASPVFAASGTGTLGCSAIDGAGIFGYDTYSSEYKLIGGIVNEFDSNSIANQFGAGNEFDSDSIYDTFGDFGSEFSSYSAFDDFASEPPILVDDNFNFIGYLTTNISLTPSVSPYVALGCANDSFASLDSDLENAVFESIPDSYSPAYSPAINEPAPVQVSCPANSTLVGSTCTCDSGYVTRNGVCMTYTQDCQNTFGNNAIGVQGPNQNSSCSCATGYEWNQSQTSCIAQPSATVSANSAQSQAGGSLMIKSNLQIGVSGTDVVTLQKFLEGKGFLTLPAGTTEGYFGSLTKQALILFQQSAGLPATGYCGPMTRSAINATSSN